MLAATDATAPISLYLHIPFCDELCLYCGCSTAVARRSDVRRAYANLLVREIVLVAAQLDKRRRVNHVHWGGGTPTALPAKAMREVDAALRQHFDVDRDAEVAVELDPRHLGGDRIAALAVIGTRRVSFGVQDFDPKVQEAIGRIQSQAQTAAAVSAMRGEIISRLLCDPSVNLGAVARRHNLPLVWPLAALWAMERGGLLVLDHGRIRLRETGRPFLRSVAALFDPRLTGAGRHSQAV